MWASERSPPATVRRHDHSQRLRDGAVAGAPLAAQCAAANITYWLMVATDAASARYLESLGVERCFMLPGSEGRAKAEQPYVCHVAWCALWIGATWRNTEAVAKFFRQPAYAMHAIYLQGGVTSKVHHIREARLAAEPPEYYSSPRLLTFSLEVDQALADFKTWPNEQHSHEEIVQTHLRSLDKQLAQAWHGFGAALALDRTLVLPHLRCHCVRAGFAVFDCRHMGDITTTLPFTCISDHVWNLNVLYAGNSSAGPHRLSIREHTFLEHPDYPQRLKSSVAVVAHKPGTACRGQQEPCIMEAGSTPGGGLQQLHLSRPATSAQLASLLAPYQRIQRIHIDQPQHVFTRFDQDAEQRQYEALTRLLTVEWCCRRERDRGSLDPRHQLYMRPWGSRQYDRLCQVTKPLLGNVTYWC